MGHSVFGHPKSPSTRALIMYEQDLSTLLVSYGIPETAAQLGAYFLIIAAITAVTFIATVIVRRSLLAGITKFLSNKDGNWKQALVKYRVFDKLSWFLPITVASLALDLFLEQTSGTYLFFKRLTNASVVIVAVISLTAFLSSLPESRPKLSSRRQRLRSYTDAGRIIVSGFGVVVLISIFTGESLIGIFSILGGLTAITLLIFKDAILGFVASIQINTIDLVRLGDWIEMNQCGADGDVIEVSVHTVRVQN